MGPCAVTQSGKKIEPKHRFFLGAAYDKKKKKIGQCALGIKLCIPPPLYVAPPRV